MSKMNARCHMPVFSEIAAHDETRAMIRARIACLLTSGTVATQVNRRLCSKGRCSPWMAPPDPAGNGAVAPPSGRNKQGRDGWRSNNSWPGSR